ncbi:flagellin [Natronosalvus vescus]|uniref:flagellin n=1 Tax=Natronosalvus vescus TaxID=2953881 RepID=UPI002091A6F4|nr:flagellin [Natronosalvus vescus]
MARISITHLILFLAVVSAATIAAGVLVTEAGLYAQAIDDENEREQAASRPT